jgi:transmembrane 9 superfamily protein 2/4
MAFAVLGFLSPANRGSLLVALLLMFVLMGCPAGYVSAVFCKMFQGAGTDRLRNTLLTATVFPGAVFAVFFVLNLLIWGDRSTGAVPFGTLVALLVFWFGMSLPLVFVGSWLGFRRAAVEHPVRTNAIPRQIPDQVPPPLCGQCLTTICPAPQSSISPARSRPGAPRRAAGPE